MSDKISLLVEATDGRPFRCFKHDGKTFIESPESREYQLRVKNKTDERIKAVIAVDSLNIITGKPAGDDPNEAGYILQPHEEQIFKGYRVDDDTVARFTFVKRDKSYATEKGSGAGNGVIAVRAYQEKESEAEKQLKKLKQRVKDLENQPREKEYIPYDRPYPVYPWRPYWERPYYFGYPWYSTICKATSGGDGATKVTWGGVSTSAVFNGSAVQNCSNTAGVELRAASMGDIQCSVAQSFTEDESPWSMGSSWGDAIKDSVKTVEFEVGKLLAEVTIYYTTLDGLKALGVDVTRAKQVAFPEAFKREYASPPSGWKR